MDHKNYIRKAIEVAKKSEKENGVAIGAILVKDGEIIAEGRSSVWKEKNPSGHGESNCIRMACQTMNTLDLNGCVLYGTLEPCSMCLCTAVWANLSAIYFGAYRKDVVGNNYEIEDWSAEETAKKTHLVGGGKIKVSGGILREECAKLLKDYKNWQKL